MKATFLLLLLCLVLPATAQTTLQGVVTDHNGQAVPFANVYLVGSYDGTSTDEAGAFSFKTTLTGEQTVAVSFMGFAPTEKRVNLDHPQPPQTLTLRPDHRQLQAVQITAGAFEASDKKRSALLNSRDIVTTAGATADIMGALNTLPGTQKVGEEGKLFVRGGDSYETKTFIDGLLVANPYNATVPDVPARGRFSPFLFSGMAFSSGGYSAEFGQALSSALLLQSQDLAEESQTGISLMSVGGSLSRTKRWEITSLAGSVEYNNLQPYMRLVPQRQDWVHLPETTSGSVVFRHKTSSTGLLKVYGTYAHSHLGLIQPNLNRPDQPTPVALRNRNVFLNTSFQDTFAEKWTLQTGMTYTHTHDSISAGALRVSTGQHVWNGKAVAIRNLSRSVTLRTGLEAQLHGYRQHLTIPKTNLMKKLILLPLLFLALFTHAQASYEAALGEALGQMQAADSPEKAQGVANRMSRIADAEPKAWLPAYYAAFTRINLSFMLQEDQQRETLLDQAQTYLDRAFKLQPKESELYVLQGYLHQARLVISPMMRGMKYSGLSTAALDKAKELNPNNPRVYYLLGQNTYNRPAMFGGGPEAAKPLLLTAQEKYGAHAPTNALAPNWGEKRALQLLAKCQ